MSRQDKLHYPRFLVIAGIFIIYAALIMGAAPALAQTWCPNDTGSANGTNGISIPQGALSVPHFNITASGGSGGGTAASGMSYYSALQAIQEQMDLQQEQVDSYLDASATLETYDSGGGGHTTTGDTSPIELSAAQCQHDSTKKLPNGKLPVIPGAGGFGMDTPAGRGGKIIKVTNLNDSGSGSLRACVNASGPRTCVFEVSGTIELDSNIVVNNPYLTIAGQTAPSPGITLKGAGLPIRTHDVLVQHLRIRVGDDPDGPAPGNRDAFSIDARDIYNVVVDHVSASWAIDEVASTWYPIHDITIRNSIISEGLNDSLHPQGKHSKGLLLGNDSQNISVTGNLMASNVERAPRMKGGVSAFVANNVMYNIGSSSYSLIGPYNGDNTNPNLASFVGNEFIDGPDTPSGATAIQVRSGVVSGTKIYHTDNIASSVFKNSSSLNVEVSEPPIWAPGYAPLVSGDTREFVFSNAGARPADRDSVDNRVINGVITKTGRIIDSQSEVGGWPSLAKNYRVFNVPDNPNGDDDGDGYTNLEEVLHQYAAQVEGCG